MKHDKRRRTDAQKRKTREKHLATADKKRRQALWQRSEAAAHAASYPINALITVLSDSENIKIVSDSLWRRLRRLMARHGLPFYAMRGPEYAPRHKLHLHIALHLPEALYGDVAAILADVTNKSMAPFIYLEGRRLGGSYGVVTKSQDPTWMLQRHVKWAGGSYLKLVKYTAKGAGKAKAIGRHQRSGELIDLTKAYDTPERAAA